jgi:hypothetical protein
MAEVLSVERKGELDSLVDEVGSVAGAAAIIAAHRLRADPGPSNNSVFYYGAGFVGAKALTIEQGFVRLEGTERGYFLDRVTQKLNAEGKIARGSAENLALFGDRTKEPKTPGLWGEASRECSRRATASARQKTAWPMSRPSSPIWSPSRFGGEKCNGSTAARSAAVSIW